MKLHPMKLITIVAEEILRDQLAHKILELGAKGCSYHSTLGLGTHKERHNDVFSANFQMKVVCPPNVADKILSHLDEHYFGKFAIVAWVSDVEVVPQGALRRVAAPAEARFQPRAPGRPSPTPGQSPTLTHAAAEPAMPFMVPHADNQPAGIRSHSDYSPVRF